MQYEIFTIPVFNPEEGLEKLNRFLRGHKVVQVDKELVRLGVKQILSCFCKKRREQIHLSLKKH